MKDTYQYPNGLSLLLDVKTPRKKPRKQKLPAPLESAVVASCIKWLWNAGCFIWRNNTGAYKTAHGSYVRFGLKGSSDIIGIIGGAGANRGKFIAIEVKTKKNKQNPAQKVFEERINNNGGYYFVARSIDDLEKFVRPLL